MFVVFFVYFSFFFQFEQFSLDGSFESFGAIRSVSSDVLEGAFGFFFESRRVDGDEAESFVMRGDGQFSVLDFLFDDL